MKKIVFTFLCVVYFPGIATTQAIFQMEDRIYQYTGSCIPADYAFYGKPVSISSCPYPLKDVSFQRKNVQGALYILYRQYLICVFPTEYFNNFEKLAPAGKTYLAVDTCDIEPSRIEVVGTADISVYSLSPNHAQNVFEGALDLEDMYIAYYTNKKPARITFYSADRNLIKELVALIK